MTRRIARDVGLLLASFALWFVGHDALEAVLGESTARTLVAWIAAFGGVILLVTIIPVLTASLVTGMREILAEPATGPVRLPSIRRRSR